MDRRTPWGEISARLGGSVEVERLAAAVGQGAAATRLPPSAAAWVGDLLAQRFGRPLLVVVPHEAEARAWLAGLALVAGDAAGAAFPAPPLSPYQEAEASLGVRADEVVALDRARSGELRAIVATPRALFRRLPDPTRLVRVELARGAPLDPAELAGRLAALGFVRVDLVAEVGDFALRGGVVDLWPPGEPEPLRLDLLGDEIESIRPFDAESQRSRADDRRTLSVRPLTLFWEGPEAMSRLAGVLGALAGDEPDFETVEHLAALEEGRGFAGWESFLPLVEDDTRTLARAVPEALVVVLDREAVLAEARRHAERLAAEFAARREHRRFVVAPELLEHPLAEVEAIVAAAALAVEPLGAPGAIDFGAAPTDLFHGQLARFPNEIAGARARGERPLVVADAERFGALGELLEGRGLELGASGVELVAGELERGFRLPAAGVSIYGEAQLLARAAPARRRPRGRFGPFVGGLRDLRVGDYVVHADHGIGQFVGLRTVAETAPPPPLPSTVAAAAPQPALESESLELAYASGKRLFVPVDRLHLVQKYGGIEGLAPRLDQLGGTSWNRTKTRVQKAMRDMADELLKLYAQRRLARAPILAGDTDLERQFGAAFPFEETEDQSEAIATILADLERAQPMDRLLVGDVGFGKTEVAMRAAFRAVDSGYQVAVLAPTTILADQHLERFQERFEGFAVTIERISRLRTGKDLTELKRRIAAGKVDILVGTHRLLSQDVEFQRLGLLVVDEEQRFGVAQKERLKQLKRDVHVLAMTATPLPRTLQMSLAGVRDISVIETPPKDRMAVETAVLPYSDELVRDAIEFELGRGGQVYYVYNRVESIEDRAGKLRELLPELRITVGHGQLDERELYRRMHAFTAREHDLLLATTIIENGIDIPSVNTMIVHRADRFGLAQLYQLRGRVGRSHELGYCYLLVPSDRVLAPDARKRLEALREFTELGAGFRIAARDLEIRGAGNLLGAQQSGHIAELGIETYLRMLEETVRELKGEAVEEGPSTALDLPVPMSIPRSYIADENLRMEIYRKIAAAEASREELVAELTDRFGRPPASVGLLLDLAELKREAEALRVQSISAAAGQLTFRLRRDARIDVDRLIRFVSERPGAAFSPAGVLTLPIPAGQAVVAAARGTLAEITS